MESFWYVSKALRREGDWDRERKNESKDGSVVLSDTTDVSENSVGLSDMSTIVEVDWWGMRDVEVEWRYDVRDIDDDRSDSVCGDPR
jgi:hypothetical protein